MVWTVVIQSVLFRWNGPEGPSEKVIFSYYLKSAWRERTSSWKVQGISVVGMGKGKGEVPEVDTSTECPKNRKQAQMLSPAREG